MNPAAVRREPPSGEAGWSRDIWLEQRLGTPAWRLDPQVPGWREAMTRVLDPQGFAYARVPTADVAMLTLLTNAGFRVVDTTITTERSADGLALPADGRVRLAGPGDRGAIVAIARRSFLSSRFHLDPRVAVSVADTTRADWVDGFFEGSRGSAMVVAGPPGAPPAGFLLLVGPSDGTLVIDLIAVDAPARGRGLAADMIAFAAGTVPGISRLRVGTQAANIGSLRLYERLGFRIVSTHYVLHLHQG